MNDYIKTQEFKPIETVRLECMECGKVFVRKGKLYNVTCPRCKSADVDLA